MCTAAEEKTILMLIIRVDGPAGPSCEHSDESDSDDPGGGGGE